MKYYPEVPGWVLESWKFGIRIQGLRFRVYVTGNLLDIVEAKIDRVGLWGTRWVPLVLIQSKSNL